MDDAEGSCWLGFETLPEPLSFSRPLRVLAAHRLEDVCAVVAAAEAAALGGCHVVGLLAYESAPAFDPALRVPAAPLLAGFPLVWFGVYATATPAPAPPPVPPPPSPPLPPPWEPSCDRAAYDAAIAVVRAAIHAGHVYQVNHTLRLRRAWAAPPACDGSALGALLRAQRGGGFGAYLHTGAHRVLSASPELFFHWDRGARTLRTRPMKGTRPRGVDAAEDAALRADLAGSEKDAAENLMIVDLLRNDLSRVAARGSVTASALFSLRALPTVWQMTSDVACATAPGACLLDVLRALFPCGSVTGAPKVAAMQLIAGLEPEARGVYCGAVLHLAPGAGGAVTASVPIRTLALGGGEAAYGCGGGVTWGSSAAGEWEEALAKAAVLFAACGGAPGGAPPPGAPPPPPPPPLCVGPWFDLLETLRAEGGRAPLAALHLARMRTSADFLGFPWDGARAGACVDAAARACAHGGTACRLRLLLSPDGAFACACAPPPGGLPSLPGGGGALMGPPALSLPPPLPVALAVAPTPRRHPLLRHKTSDRRLYEWHQRAAGVGGSPPAPFDVLLFNEDGHATEFTIGNLVVRAAAGAPLVTPPVDHGLLPGVLRGALLAAGVLREAPLTPAAVVRAEEAWLINSVRGWVPVKLVEGGLASLSTQSCI
jgi:para-aminobenzoate synthetase/4-amino-4-deoxychorismate lyase